MKAQSWINFGDTLLKHEYIRKEIVGIYIQYIYIFIHIHIHTVHIQQVSLSGTFMQENIGLNIGLHTVKNNHWKIY